jgi:hypothetical protein
MAEGPAHDPAAADPPTDNCTRSDSEAESTAMTTSSSPTRGASMMTKGEIPELTNFFKKTSVLEEELQAYHSRGWLTGNVLSSIPEVDVPTVHGSSVLCFESHLLAGLGLPPSKFMAAIMNYLGCSLVHFNANAIAALSSFVMLCECWLGIPPDSSLFWYYYSPSRYVKFVYSGIGLSLRRHRWDEYIPTLFKGCSVAEKISRRNGSMLICTFNPHGRTNSCSPSHQGSTERVTDECAIGCLGQARL